jgi:hypothetical protein
VGATKQANGTEYELRVSRLNGTIGGTAMRGARDPDRWHKRAMDNMTKMLAGEDPHPPIISVRRHDECP